MSVIVGIDFGTTNSVMAVFDGHRPVAIPNAFGSTLTASAVQFLSDNRVIVGERAKRSAIVDAPHTVLGIKRLIGRRYNEVFDLAEVLNYPVTLGQDNLAVVDIRGVHYTPQFIAALVLKSMRVSAEAFLGTADLKAVITVPAYFNPSQREATRQAAMIAGFDVCRILTEPTSAVMAYGLRTRSAQRSSMETVVVCDLGGGTFDVTVLEVGDGVIEVRGTAGDGLLGGDDFDEVIIDWVRHDRLVKSGAAVFDDPSTLQLLRASAVQAKHELSAMEQTQIYLPMFAEDEPLPLSRSRFNEMSAELLERLKRPCCDALATASVAADCVDRVLLVGGGTRVPAVGETIRRVFGKEPSKLMNPDEAIAAGASVQGGVLAGDVKDQLLLDVFPWPVSVEIAGRGAVCLIRRDTTIPTRKSEMFKTVNRDQRSVEINVLEGDAPRAADNRQIARLALHDLVPTDGQDVEIEVTVDIDTDASLKVIARQIATGRQATTSVTAAIALSDRELQTMRAQLERIGFA